MPKPPPLERPYIVATGPVTLSVMTGDGQAGEHIVLLDDNEITPDAPGDIQDLTVGRGRKLVGKLLKIKSVVSAVNDSTTKVNVEYLLKGGPSEERFDLNDTVPASGGGRVFVAKFRFIAAPVNGPGA
jgi:hypothetical protein